MSAIVFGGYGVFGSLVCKELARLGVPPTVAGRDPSRAQIVADATDFTSCAQAIRGHRVAVSCAGPYNGRSLALLDACIAEGVHYADIADDRAHVRGVRERDASLRANKLCAVYGASSLPGISSALALLAAGGAPAEGARVTLFIGNDNPKGGAAIRTLVKILGRPIAAPQGPLTGGRGAARVEIPGFGRRTAFDIEAPELDLFPALFGAKSVTVKVGFEIRAATRFFTALAAVGAGYGERTARMLERLGRLDRRGSSGGAIVVDLSHGPRAALWGEKDAQRMAALPCALAAAALHEGVPQTGARLPHELFGAEPLLASIAAQGFQLVCSAHGQ